MEWESNGRIWERQQSERVERAAGRKVRLAEGVRSVFVQRLQGMPLTEAFTAMDQNGDGVLSVDEFKRGLRALKIGLMPWEVGEFVSLVDSDLSGSISKAEFIDMFSRPLMTGGPHAPVAATGVPKNGTDDAVPLPGATRGSRPRAVVDREMTARLDALEELSAAVVDPDEYGTHSRADAIDAEARVLRDRACWLTKHVYKELAKRKLSLSAAFARFDKHSTGRLTSASLLRGLRSMDIAVDTVAYDMLLLAFRKDRQGAFTEEEFRTHFGQISQSDLQRMPTRRRSAKLSSKGGAAGILERLREQDESKHRMATRADGLPERKRRSDGTPTPLAEEPRQIDGGSAEEIQRAAIDADISTTMEALQQQIEEVMQGETSSTQECKSAPATGADAVGAADSEEIYRDDFESTTMDAVACAGRRMALDLPRPSSAGCARPSLLLRMPYSTLLMVSQQLPRASRVSLCISCRELCRLLGRGPTGRWDAEAAVLRQMVFDGWSTSFFDDRAIRRLRSERRKLKESKQREEQEKGTAESAVGREERPGGGSALQGTGEPTLEEMLRQIGGSAAVREANNGNDEADPTTDAGRVMSDDRYRHLVQYLELRQLTLAPCHDAREAAWRRNAVSLLHFQLFRASEMRTESSNGLSSASLRAVPQVRAERLAYTAGQRRAWAHFTLQQSRHKRDNGQQDGSRRSKRSTRRNKLSRLQLQQDGGNEELPHVFRQRFNSQTGRYEGVVEVVPRVRWYEVLSAAHSGATVAELEKTAVKNETATSSQQQKYGDVPAAVEDGTDTLDKADRAQRQAQLIPAVEGIPIPLNALESQLHHELVAENIPREAATMWLALLPPRLDPLIPSVAIQSIEDTEVRKYAEALLLRRPMWFEKVCRDICHDAGASTAAEVLKVFEQRCLCAKEHICGICQGNFAMDNKRPDAPCRARDQSTSMCEHEYCTSCWHRLARRSDSEAAQIPCPTCRGNVRPFLAEVPYNDSLQLPAGTDAVVVARAEPGTSGSDESFELLDDAVEDLSIDGGSNHSSSHAESMEDAISIDAGASSDSIVFAEELPVDEEGTANGGVQPDATPSAGMFSLLLVDAGPTSAAGSGKWSVLCRVVSAGLSPADLSRLGASCKLFRTPLLGCEPDHHLDRRSTLVGTKPCSVGNSGIANGAEVATAERCIRTVGCQCAQCDNSTAAVLDAKQVNPCHFTLPEYIAWHRVCDVLARRGGESVRKSQRAQIQGMALLAQAKPKGLSWAGMLHKGVEPWVKHVRRQMALREAKQQPRVVAKKQHQNQKQRGTKLKLKGDQLMRAGDYVGAAEAYSRAKEAAARTRDSHTKFNTARGAAGAFSRVAIM